VPDDGCAASRLPEVVRWSEQLHDAVARSDDDAEASTRPPGTTRRELLRMVADVQRKLDLSPTHDLLEIGCGTGVLGLPLARRANTYLGIDIASEALAVLSERLASAGLTPTTEVRRLDFISARTDEIGSLGSFDRVLAYAVLHYAEDEAEVDVFLRHIISVLRPGGVALVGSLPLEELQDATTGSGGGAARKLWTATGLLVGDRGPLRRTARWRLASLGYRMYAKGRRRARRGDARRVLTTGGASVRLTYQMLESLLDAIDGSMAWEWLPPAIGTPLFADRADLLVRRAGPAE